jgi:division protein CdvB (Snf7/Vps24/ESCRT-III family)
LSGFASKWHKHANSKGGSTSFEPVKLKIEQASSQLRLQIAKLDQVAAKLREEDDEIFSRIVSSIREKDNDRAKVLASELSVMLKMGGMLTEARLTLEQLTLRLSTVTDMGDLADAATPSLEAIRAVGPSLASLVPDSEHEMGEISELLSGALAGQIGTNQPAFETSNDAAESVVQAATIQQATKFPEVPESSDELEAETA